MGAGPESAAELKQSPCVREEEEEWTAAHTKGVLTSASGCRDWDSPQLPPPGNSETCLGHLARPPALEEHAVQTNVSTKLNRQHSMKYTQTSRATTPLPCQAPRATVSPPLNPNKTQQLGTRVGLDYPRGLRDAPQPMSKAPFPDPMTPPPKQNLPAAKGLLADAPPCLVGISEHRQVPAVSCVKSTTVF